MLPDNLVLGQVYPPIHHFTSEQTLKYLNVAKAMDTHLEADHLSAAKHASLYHHTEHTTSNKDLATWIKDRLDNPFKGAIKALGVIDLTTDDLVAVTFVKSLPFTDHITIAGAYTAPRYRRKGIFKAIHTYILNLTDIRKLKLHTVIGTKVNDTSIDEVYSHFGYKKTSTTYIKPMNELSVATNLHTPKYYPDKDFRTIITGPSPYEEHILSTVQLTDRVSTNIDAYRTSKYKRITLSNVKEHDPYISMKIVSDQLYRLNDIRWLVMSSREYDTSRYNAIVDILKKDLHPCLVDIVPALKAIAYEVPVSSDKSHILHDIIKGTPTYDKWELSVPTIHHTWYD